MQSASLVYGFTVFYLTTVHNKMIGAKINKSNGICQEITLKFKNEINQKMEI